MRWDALFDDLEAQLAEESRREWEAEAADRTRKERAEVGWLDRAARSTASLLTVTTAAGRLNGILRDLGRDWLLIELRDGRPALVSAAAVVSVSGLSARSESDRPGRRFAFGIALRAVSRDRLPVAVHDRLGGVVVGTLDVVGSDYVEIAEHPADTVRRAGSVTGRRVVPFGAIATVQQASLV